MKDCVGNDVHLDAILKVYHFTGARRRKHFMYKQVGETVGDLVKIHHLPIGTIQDDYYLVKESEALTDSVVVVCHCNFHIYSGLKISKFHGS